MGDGARARTVSSRLEHGSGAGAVARELVLGLLADETTTVELRHDAALVAYELDVDRSDGTTVVARVPLRRSPAERPSRSGRSGE
jgi:hypothetical protein